MSSHNIPSEIQFQLRDEARDIDYPATEVTHIFEGDPEPMGTDDGVVTVVVDMSEDGSHPVAISSLSSRFMVSDYNWTSEQNVDGAFAKLSVNGVALQK
ncbi:hypothetical protein GGI15_000110 [Coemansia interrupta]|uniref:Uncharacterized protein n=1 Tax=Coemansia interrupta TaxID=1126814 RepID=A0A9W8LQ23_9FUNG|nr:hypothetical protein GGI15_000110 [Coemansia interrupta]